MKVFDEKGKLFGKINIIDLLVIIIVLVALVVVGVKVLDGDKADELPPSTSTSTNTPATTPTKPTTPAPTPTATSTPTPTPVPTSTPLPKTKLTYTVRVTAQHKEVAEQLAEYVDFAEGKKDQIMHSGVMIENAYVVDYWTEPCRYNVLSSGEVEMFTVAETEAAGLVDICLVVESIVSDARTSKVGALEVRIGKSHILKTAHMEFINGIVVDCVWEPMEE